MSRSIRGALALGAAALPLVAFAADVPRPQSLVVTATLGEREVADTLSSITVIDRAALDLQQPRELAELLRARPGVDVISNGPYGKTTGVFLRGTASNQTLLLIDGVRMGSVTAGTSSWEFLPPRLIERVEVLRGPRAGLYGADAVGGVVQVFTRSGAEDAFAPWALAGGGSFATYELAGGVGGSLNGTGVNLAASHTETDGIALHAGGDRKGFRNTSLLASASHDIEGGARVGITGLRSQGNTQFVGGETDFVHQSLAGRAEMRLLPQLASRVLLHEGRDESDTADAFGRYRFDTRRRAVHWLNTLHAGPHELLGGVDYRHDRAEGTTAYAERSRANLGLFGQALLDFEPVSFAFSARWDDNRAYGQEVTGGAAAGWAFDSRHRMRAGYATAFRAPSFNDLYFPGFGNPDLVPESSASVEVGMLGDHGSWYWDAVLYHTVLNDLIETAFVDGVFAPANVARARVQGAEVSTGLAIAHWSIVVAFGWADPVDRDSGDRLRLRARESARVELDRGFDRLTVGVTGIVQGHRYNDTANTERLGGFALLHLRAGWALAADWSLRLSVDNALDRDYVTARDSFNGFDYQQPGRSLFLSLRYGE